MKLVLDLDETLYNEYDYVYSGYSAVSRFFSIQLNKNYDEIFYFMLNWHEVCGREGILESTFEFFAQEKSDRFITQKALYVYRNHRPRINVYPEVKGILAKYEKSGLTLITDGNPEVQNNKINALGIEKYFHKIYTTWSYGKDKSKPSIYCFELASKSLGLQIKDLVYVGDDPRKDFVNMNKAGGTTIRVRMGKYKDINLPGKLEATYAIDSISMLPNLLNTYNILIT